MAVDVAHRLQEYYETEFPSWTGVKVSSMSRIGEGWENEVYSFRLDFEKSGERTGRELILRIYQGDGAPEKSRREYETMGRLRDLNFPVPRVDLHVSDPLPLGKPFTIMEKVEGRLMGEVFFESSRRRKGELLDLFCSMFAKLHSLDWEPFAGDPSSYTKQDPQLRMIDRISRIQEDFRSLDKTEFDPVFDWLRKRTSDVGFGEPSLVHWDYHPWNIIMKDDGTACVIDWTQAQVMDFRFDLGWTLLLVSTHAHPWLARSVLRRYGRMTQKRIEHMEYFEVAACLRRLFAVSVSLTHGAERVGMRKGAEAVLKEHAAPLRRVYDVMRRRTGIAVPELEALLSKLR